MFRVLTNLRIILASDALISLCLIVLLQRTLHCYIQIKDVISSTTFKHDHKQFGTVIQKFATLLSFDTVLLLFLHSCDSSCSLQFQNHSTTSVASGAAGQPLNCTNEGALVNLFNHLWKLIIFLLEHISIRKLQTLFLI